MLMPIWKTICRWDTAHCTHPTTLERIGRELVAASGHDDDVGAAAWGEHDAIPGYRGGQDGPVVRDLDEFLVSEADRQHPGVRPLMMRHALSRSPMLVPHGARRSVSARPSPADWTARAAPEKRQTMAAPRPTWRVAAVTV